MLSEYFLTFITRLLLHEQKATLALRAVWSPEHVYNHMFALIRAGKHVIIFLWPSSQKNFHSYVERAVSARERVSQPTDVSSGLGSHTKCMCEIVNGLSHTLPKNDFLSLADLVVVHYGARRKSPIPTIGKCYFVERKKMKSGKTRTRSSLLHLLITCPFFIFTVVLPRRH